VRRLATRAQSDADVAEAVLRYFRAHPEAADGLEGIARWRLLEETSLQEVEATARALRLLVDRGLLVEEKVPGMTSHYRLAPGAATAAPSREEG